MATDQLALLVVSRRLLFVVAVTISVAPPWRVDSPSKVTRAFSEAQVRLALLKRAMMVLSERGIEKLV